MHTVQATGLAEARCATRGHAVTNLIDIYHELMTRGEFSAVAPVSIGLSRLKKHKGRRQNSPYFVVPWSRQWGKPYFQRAAFR